MKKIQSVRTKILIYFMVLFLILSGSLLAIYELSMQNIHNLANESVEKSLEKTNADTYKLFSEALKLANIVSQDGNIQVSLRRDVPSTVEEFYKERLAYNYDLYDMNRFEEDVDGIYVVGANGTVFRSKVRSLKDKDFREEEWYKEAVRSDKAVWLEPHYGPFMVTDEKHNMFSLAVPIHDRLSMKTLGVVLVDVLAEKLEANYQGSTAFNGRTFMLNEDNEVIYADHDDNKLLDAEKVNMKDVVKKADENKGRLTQGIRINGEKYLVSTLTMDINNWKLMEIVPYDEVFAEVQGMGKTMIVMMVLFLILAVLFAVSAANKISRPIRKMQAAMKVVEKGNMDTTVEVEGNDELSDLARSFNRMVGKLDKLMKNEVESEKKLRKAELKALQSQINPHFLYNTLDSINWMARMNRVDKVEQMVNSLTTLFRISLSRGRTFIRVSEELNHVESYFLIQKIRYDKILDYKIEVPDSIMDYITIKMILQPLVENAIYHGIKEKGEKGLITVMAHELEDRIIFCVQDTGLGMTADKLKEIRKMMDKGIDYDPNAYGVINVQKRIQTYFGKEYGLKFESEYGVGTRVYVQIPKRTEGQEIVEDSNR